MAPEWGIRRVLKNMSNVDYLSGDLDPRLADLRVDITEMPFRDDYFDLLICVHVLEHIPDDGAAMREIRRVISNNGAAVLQHPIHYYRSTYEDAQFRTPEDRLREFGQVDHVRIYGSDFPDRLKAAGLDVSVVRYEVQFTELEINRYGLVGEDSSANKGYSGDEIYLCRKSVGNLSR
jgi:SAM-dependent methyltransferase